MFVILSEKVWEAFQREHAHLRALLAERDAQYQELVVQLLGRPAPVKPRPVAVSAPTSPQTSPDWQKDFAALGGDLTPESYATYREQWIKNEADWLLESNFLDGKPGEYEAARAEAERAYAAQHPQEKQQ